MADEYSQLERYHSGKATPPPPQIITVDAAGGGDVTTIRAALALTGSATQARPYTVYVRNGTYNELQLTIGDWVTVEGQSRDGVIMISDGLRTDIDPVSGQRYCDMLESDKHGFWMTSASTLRNMTIIVNDVKYCQHSDGSGAWSMSVENCIMRSSTGFPVGVGLHASQHITWTDCVFEYTGAGTVQGLLLHNWNEQAAACSATLVRCSSVSCAIAILTELGSEQSDLIKFDACTSPSAIVYAVTAYYWHGGGHAITEIPYNLGVWVHGGTIPSPTISYNAEDRPDLANIILID